MNPSHAQLRCRQGGNHRIRTQRQYLFTTYFNEEPLFNQLKQYYKSDKYRFEIPEGDLKQVRQILDEFSYELVIEDSWKDYCVAADKEADSSTVLRNSVTKTRQGHNGIFLMKNKLSVEQALEDGATHWKNQRLQRRNSRGKPTDHSGANRHSTGTYK